ncbi:hypothetical protein [Arthrobacter methylotrophus]|uniref:hypothetical protein n=1 Tax=Arthrobacter methylotrophus TaxID=121291 RepID=UPI0031EC41B3
MTRRNNQALKRWWPNEAGPLETIQPIAKSTRGLRKQLSLLRTPATEIDSTPRSVYGEFVL